MKNGESKMNDDYFNFNNNFNLVTSNQKYNYTLCTIAGIKYLLKLLALYKSLSNTTEHFQLYVLCMDQPTLDFLQKASLENMVLISLEEIEDENLLSIKDSRSTSEYCWTLKAPLMAHILNIFHEEYVLYCDSDLYFFFDPHCIFEKLNEFSIYICNQRDSEEVEKVYGKYQAGVIGFRGDEVGLGALQYWAEKCLERCSIQPDPQNDSFGDQKYLDAIPELYSSVYCETHLGVDAAPWNSIYRNESDFNKTGDHIYLKEDIIIAFHFATLQIYNELEYDLWSYGELNIPTFKINNLYVPYIQEIQKCISMVQEIDPSIPPSMIFSENPENALTYYYYNELIKESVQYDELYYLCSIVSNDYVTRAMALYNSIKRFHKNFHIWFCAMDDEAYVSLKRVCKKNVTILKLSDIEDEQISNIKASRSVKELCWSIKAWLLDYIIVNYKVKKILYCDSDIYFFSPLKDVYDEWGTYSFLMCTQRAPAELEHRCGYYQAGLIGIKNDGYGKKILDWWKYQCLNWCYDSYDELGFKWGDQKYLEQIPSQFENIKVVTNIGINAAPWNLILNNLGYRVNIINNKLFINKEKLCVYHFGSIKINNHSSFEIWHESIDNVDKKVMNLIYKPYFLELMRNQRELSILTSANISFSHHSY